MQNIIFIILSCSKNVLYITFVFYGEIFIYQNCGETVLRRGESGFIRITSVDKRISVATRSLKLIFEHLVGDT